MQTTPSFFTLLRGARVLSPEDLGRCDILIAGPKIAAVKPQIEVPAGLDCQVIDLDGYTVAPGLIDAHVHIIGGGGEGGFATRTPEITLSKITASGVTTVVGCLGTDGATRHVASLLAKARGLEEEGVSAYIYTGAYQAPPPTLTGGVREDIILIDKVIGAGEIAVSDHRSAQPSQEDIRKLAAAARVGGMLSGKAGVVNIHLGDGPAGLDMLFSIAADSEIPRTQFIPTHVNRNPRLLAQSIEWAKQGGYMDVTSGICGEGSIPAAKAIAAALAAGVDPSRITMTSDGNGSMPRFNDRGDAVGVMVADQSSLLAAVRSLRRQENIPLADAIRPVTRSVAQALKLWPQKGCVQAGADADLAVLTPDIALHQLWAKGRQMIDQGKPIVWGVFEQPATPNR